MMAATSTADLDPALAFRQDLAAFNTAVVDKDYESASAYCNRFATDAMYFSDGDDARSLAFLGLIMRIAAEDHAMVSIMIESRGPKPGSRTTPAGDPSGLVSGLCRVINEAVADPSGELQRVCSAFYDFEVSISGLERDRHELESYPRNLTLSPGARTVLSSIFSQNLSLLSDPPVAMAMSLAAEMARLSHVAKFEQRDLIFYILMRVVGLTHELPRLSLPQLPAATRSVTEAWIRDTGESVSNLLKRLDGAELPTIWSDTAHLAGDMMLAWRKSVLAFGTKSPPQLVGVPVRPSELGGESGPYERLHEKRTTKSQ